MTIAVDLGRKATKPTNQLYFCCRYDLFVADDEEEDDEGMCDDSTTSSEASVPY